MNSGFPGLIAITVLICGIYEAVQHPGFWVLIGFPALLAGLYYGMTRYEQKLKDDDAAKAKLAQDLTERSDEQWQARLDGDEDKYAYGEFPPAVHRDGCDCDDCKPAPHVWG